MGSQRLVAARGVRTRKLIRPPRPGTRMPYDTVIIPPTP